MAPWPEQGTEPKAPDKSADNYATSSLLKLHKETLTSTVDSMLIKTTEQVVVAETESRVSDLDECGLKALLDEAINYKHPRDVEGKSTLFKELLHSVESDKKYPDTMVSLRGRPTKNMAKKSRRRQQNRRDVGALDKANDQTALQDLVQAFSVAETGNNYKGRGKSRSKTDCNTINTPQKEGGSQSSGINDETSSEDCSISKNSPVETIGIKYTPQILKTDINDCRCECAVDMPIEIPLPPHSPIQQSSAESNGIEQSQVQLSAKYNSVKSIVGSSENKMYSGWTIGENSAIIYPIKMHNISVLSIPPQQVYATVPKSVEEGKDCCHSSSNDEEEIDSSKVTPSSEQSAIGNRILDKGLFNLNRWDSSAVGITVLDYRDPNMSARYAKEGISDKKGLDENGNTLGSNRLENGADRKGKQRRLKVKNDKNTIMSQNIEGHRSDIANSSDIEAVVKYIESPTGIDLNKISNARQNSNAFGFPKQGKVNQKMRTVRDKSSETIGRKGRRGKDGKLHKSNSLAEISTSKLEDLTNEDSDSVDKYSLKQTTVDDFELVTDRTWELSNPYMHLANDSNSDKPFSHLRREIKCDSDMPADSEFHIVTKKQRKKKRSSASRGNGSGMKGTTSSCYYRSERGFHTHDGGRRESLYRYSMSQCDPQRRKSASSVPPSDKSADSSDLDSVHSLPVSSTTKKTLPAKKSTSSGSTPQASYADIARSVASPPRGNSNNALNKPIQTTFLEGCVDRSQSRSLSPDQVPTVVFSLPAKDYKADVYKENMDKDYPPLDQPVDRKPKINDLFVEFTVYMPKTVAPNSCVNVSVEETVLVKPSSSTNNIATSEGLTFVLENTENAPVKRPPVILLNESSTDTNVVNELVFGFEVNQQLLVGSQTEKKEVDPCVSKDAIMIESSQSALGDHDKFSNYSIPFNPDFNHDNIVEFISGEWDSVMNELAEDDGRGKIRYFNSH